MSKLIIGFIILSALLSPWAALKPHSVHWENDHLVTLHNRVALNPGNTVGQTFTATDNNLTRIRVVGRIKQKSVKGRMILSEDPSNREPMAATNFKGYTNMQTLTLRFNPIQNSKEESYYFYLESDAGNTDALEILQSASERDGEATLNHTPQPTDLMIELGYKNKISFLTLWSKTMKRMSQYKPVWLKTPWLYLYWGAFYVTLIALVQKVYAEFFWKFPESPKGDKRPKSSARSKRK